MNVLTITGPSGSGKDSILDAVLYRLGCKKAEELTPWVREHIEDISNLIVPGAVCEKGKADFMKELVSHTTRPPRVGEENGKDYFFITKEEFDAIPKVENSNYAGNYYCLSEKVVRENDAYVGAVIVDIHGKDAVKKFVEDNGGKCISLFISVDPDVIEERMRKRGDSEENIQKRLTHAKETGEFDNGKNCDYIIYNDDFAYAVAEVLCRLKEFV